MAKGKERHFGDKQSSNGFAQNPQNINRKGQPRKGISAVNHEMKEAGFDPVSKNDIRETYTQMLQLGEEELNGYLNDKSKPMLVRILAKNMLSKKGFDIIEKMLDRSQGKPVQATEVTGKDGGQLFEKINIVVSKD